MKVFVGPITSISAAGFDPSAKIRCYAEQSSAHQLKKVGSSSYPVYPIPGSLEPLLTDIDAPRESDRVVQLALLAAQPLHRLLPRKPGLRSGVIIGSARGQTERIERHHQAFLESTDRTVSPFTSPRTTGGILSATVAETLNIEALDISISVTCTSFLHSLLIGTSFLKSGMLDFCVVGGAEAALTPFTIAQMTALGIYSDSKTPGPSCKPFFAETPRRNHMALGEGAVFAVLYSEGCRDLIPDPVMELTGFGFGRQQDTSVTGMEPDGRALAAAMRAALKDSGRDSVDLVVAHAPGTRIGDEAELAAIQEVFSAGVPQIASTKHLTGHTFGAASGLSLELAALMIEHKFEFQFPYPTVVDGYAARSELKSAMITGAGFGGNVIAAVVERR